MFNNKNICLRPVVIAKSARDPGFKVNGTKADDLKYGDYSLDKIKRIRGMFELEKNFHGSF